MFSLDIDVRTGDSHSILNVEDRQRINYAKNVVIDDHVWVGAHVSILKGVHISSHSIIATRSVVTKAFDQEESLVSRVVLQLDKEKVTWTRERLYKQ